MSEEPNAAKSTDQPQKDARGNIVKKIKAEESLEAAISSQTAPRVTKEQIEARIEGKTFTAMKDVSRADDTTTICTIYLDNGFSVRGESSCVSPENFDRNTGERIAYENAFEKLWVLFGFLLAEELFVEYKTMNVAAEAREQLTESDVRLSLNDPETVDIFVNHEPFTVPYGDGSISYDEIRELAFPDMPYPKFPSCTWSVKRKLVKKLTDNKPEFGIAEEPLNFEYETISGILYPGKSIMLESGLNINMVDTRNA